MGTTPPVLPKDRQSALIPRISTALRYPRGAFLSALGRREQWRQWNEITSDRYYERLGRHRIEVDLAALGLGLEHGLDFVVEELRREVLSGSSNPTAVQPTIDAITSQKAAFVPILFHIVRRLRPKVVVETGVDTGRSAVAILAAMNANGLGDLYSVDVLPSTEVGGLIPGYLKMRWHFRSGHASNLLNDLFATVGPVGIFFHDSLHTKANMLKEFRAAHSANVPTILADNVEFGNAFRQFFGSLDDWAFREIRYHYRQILGLAIRGGTAYAHPN